MNAWMDFNDRPPEQRDAIFGPATDRMIDVTRPAPAMSHAPRHRATLRKGTVHGTQTHRR